MSALPIIVKRNSQSVGLFTLSRERELGLDRRETGEFYPTGVFECCNGIPVQYERNHRYAPLVQYLFERTLVRSCVRWIMPERL
jgi:hypothetical protein